MSVSVCLHVARTFLLIASHRIGRLVDRVSLRRRGRAGGNAVRNPLHRLDALVDVYGLCVWWCVLLSLDEQYWTNTLNTLFAVLLYGSRSRYHWMSAPPSEHVVCTFHNNTERTNERPSASAGWKPAKLSSVSISLRCARLAKCVRLICKRRWRRQRRRLRRRRVAKLCEPLCSPVCCLKSVCI